MLEKLNHIAIVVPDLKKAIANYKNGLHAKISKVMPLPNHGVSTAFIELSNTNIELLEPLGEKSPISNFLNRNINGGIHHICYEVIDIKRSISELKKKNYNLIGEGIPRIGAHGKPVVFIHPKEFNGTLIELEEI
tara:strand:+ start:400 stop:804 length:405 start_codon:yes stop_codon:yes gene_type:complete